jgi:hypothetical protein
LSLWQAIHRQLLGDTFFEILTNISVGKFSSETGASSMKKFEDGLFSTNFSKSDNSAKESCDLISFVGYSLSVLNSKYYSNIVFYDRVF